ncbi:MAG: hypothetical protein ACLGQX_07130, partial [Acidobacteriota bacterium]
MNSAGSVEGVGAKFQTISLGEGEQPVCQAIQICHPRSPDGFAVCAARCGWEGVEWQKVSHRFSVDRFRQEASFL